MNNNILVENDEIPAEIKGWNWGAFAYNMYWGIGNKTYLPLLVLIPFFNLIWIFVVGFKGNEWAWKKSGLSNNSEDIRAFKMVQASWSRSGIFALIIRIITVTFTIIFLPYIVYLLYMLLVISYIPF